MHVIISMHITPADEQDHKLQFHEENHTYMVNFKFKRILNNCLHFSSFSRHNIILIIVITIILFSSFLIKSQTLNFIKNNYTFHGFHCKHYNAEYFKHSSMIPYDSFFSSLRLHILQKGQCREVKYTHKLPTL